MSPPKTDLSYHRPAAKAGPEPRPIVEAPAEGELPLPAEPERSQPEVHLAEALFSQAVASSTLDHPLVVADSPNGDARANGESRSVPAAAPAQASIDMPAFLRRRRSLREYEEGN